MAEAASIKPVEIAVFDFDGTCISGNSPVLLVRHLLAQGKLRKRDFSRIIWWGIRYKLRLPQNESHARELVFSAFEGQPREKVDAYLQDFYEKKIAARFRADADAEIERHRAEGREVWAVTATFEPIICQAMKTHRFTRQFSTRMVTDAQGRYTRQVEGIPVEGDEKVQQISQAADAAFGKGNWVLAYAYGDHHSDRPMLKASLHPCAVTPDRPLSRFAKAHGWRIVMWPPLHRGI